MLDLWPQTLDATKQSPLAVAREQAKVLPKHTDGKIKAEVTPAQDSEGDFNFDFYLVAPKLGNYRYRLFSMSYSINLFPVNVYMGQEMAEELGVSQKKNLPGTKELLRSLAKAIESPNLLPESDYVVTANSEEEFLHVLKVILGSKRTLTVLQSLLSQLKAT